MLEEVIKGEEIQEQVDDGRTQETDPDEGGVSPARRRPPEKNLEAENRRMAEKLARLERELGEYRPLREKVAEYGQKATEYEKTFGALRQALGGKQEEAPSDLNPYDPVDQPQQHATWDRDARNQIRQDVEQTAEQKAEAAADRAYQKRVRTNITNRAEQDFKEAYPDLADPQLWPAIEARARNLYLRGEGSGEAGAVTLEDLEGLAYMVPATRKLMRELEMGRTQSKTLSDLKAASNTRGSRGSTANRDPSKMSNTELVDHLSNLSDTEKAKVLDRLPPDVRRKISDLIQY